MLDYKKVQQYIEKKNDVKLHPTQVQILKAIIRGDVICTARGVGRTMLYNGYADYLKEVVGKNLGRTLNIDEYDSIFSINDSKDYVKKHWTYDKWVEMNKSKELYDIVSGKGIGHIDVKDATYDYDNLPSGLRQYP